MHAALQVLQPSDSADTTPPAPRARWRPGAAGVGLAATIASVAIVAVLVAVRPEATAPRERAGAGPERGAAAGEVALADAVAAIAAAPPAATLEAPLTERLDDGGALVEVAKPAPEPEALATVVVSETTPAAPRAVAIAVEPPAAEPAIRSDDAAQATDAGAPPASDDRAVAVAVATFEQAVRAGDFAEGQRQLDVLAGLLPARSLTLLRMQAWFAHQSGDAVQAIVLYGEITERVPADDNAAINLALLEAAQGDVDGASERLRVLRSRSGESAALSAAMAVVGAKRP